jgi:hypothetical protein
MTDRMEQIEMSIQIKCDACGKTETGATPSWFRLEQKTELGTKHLCCWECVAVYADASNQGETS